MGKILIKGGTLVDGTGQKPQELDLVVEKGRIAQIGKDLPEEGEIIDASGLVVSPGFIDIHTHTDATIYKYPSSGSRVMQGITTEITGSCGLGNFPAGPEAKDKEELLRFMSLHDFMSGPEGVMCHQNFADFAAYFDRHPIGVNLAPLVGHGSLRIAVVGYEDRQATAQELENLGLLLEKQMQEGAWGLSSGLIYPPGSFADVDEFTALCKVLAKYGGLYTTHVRGESTTLLEAVDETIEVGRRSGAKVQVSHLKAIGVPNWGKGKKALDNIIKARAEGVDVTADQYPYEASATGLSVLLPGWSHAGGVSAMLERLGDMSCRERLLADLNKEMAVRGGPERILITNMLEDKEGFIGKKMDEIAKAWDMPADLAVIRLLAEQKGVVHAVYFSISTDDIDAIITSDIVCVGSDGRGMDIEEAAHSSCHPRCYGTFPKVLGEYVRDRGLLTLEKAIYKMTGLPAARLGMDDRGVLAVGKAADIAVFNLSTMQDMATFSQPHQYAKGVEYVLVNGGFAVKKGEMTREFHGRILRKN